MKFKLLINIEIDKIDRIFRFQSPTLGQSFILLSILTFMSRINFMLCRVEHEKSFITLGLRPTLKICLFVVMFTASKFSGWVGW